RIHAEAAGRDHKMHRVAGEKYTIFAVAVGKQQVLPPRRAGQHFVLHWNSNGALELGLHLLVAVEDRVERPMPRRILHDQERGLVVGHVIMAAAAWTIPNRKAIKQLVAAKQRLT